MAEGKSIYRKVSLDRLSSPEQLDQKLTVVPPIGWVALASLAILMAAALAWSIFGSVSNKVGGGGVLMYGDGIVTLVARAGGQVTDVSVSAGDYVAMGQAIARIALDDMVLQMEQCHENLIALENIRVETLDLDIDSMSSELYAEFGQLAGQVRIARAQYEAQRTEARKNEQDIENQKTMQTHQVGALEEQIRILDEQSKQYAELLGYQRIVDLENAAARDRLRDAAAAAPSLYSQVRGRPDYDPTLAQMELTLVGYRGQRDSMQTQISGMESLRDDDDPNPNPALEAEIANLRAQVTALNQQIRTLERQMDEYEDLLDYQRRIELANARAQDRLRNAEANAPDAYDQVRNRPDYDPSLASMESQLVNYRLQLIQEQVRSAQVNASFTDFLWGGYNQTGAQIQSLTAQFADLKQIKQQETRKRLEELQFQFSRDSVITAGFSGVVSGLTISRYDFVQPGGAVGTLIRDSYSGSADSVILYVPIGKGKLVQEGMEVNISPATVNREEHGYILGRVKAVSPYAVTQEQMMSTLQNQQLVQTFGGQAAVMEVEVELLRDTGTISGYLWSTPRGAPVTIDPGTICSGEIKVSSQRPIEMVVPFLKSLFSGTSGEETQ